MVRCRTNVRRLRLLVLQLPLVQALLYMVLLVMWAEEESLYQVNYMYVQPVVVVSILTGVWALSMAMRALAQPLEGRRSKAKFLALQAVLLLAKAQGLAARSLVWAHALPCRPPLSPAVYANLVYNSSMLAEMVVLSLAARHLYAGGAPPAPSPSPAPPPQPVFVVGEKPPALAPPPPPRDQDAAAAGHTR
ncbi:Organic solute transporter alpha-like protein, partial [Gryllus bimaculatus]